MANSVQLVWLEGCYFERRLIVEAIKKDIGNFQLRMYGDDVTFAYIKQQISQSNIFSSDIRLFIINSFPETDGTKKKAIEEFALLASKLPTDVMVIFNGLSGKEYAPLVKEIKKAGKVFVFPQEIKIRDYNNYNTNEADEYVLSKINHFGKKIDHKLVPLLIDAVSGSPYAKELDVDRAYLFVKRLCDYVGSKTAITQEDISAIAFSSDEFLIWQIYDALDLKNDVLALSLFNEGLRSAKSASSFAQEFAMSAIWRYRLLWIAKESVAKTRNKQQSTNDLSAIKKLSRSGSGRTIKMISVSDTPAFSAMQIEMAVHGKYGKMATIDCYERKDLFLILLAAEKCLRKIRSNIGEHDMLLLIETFMLEACKKIDHKQLKNIRKEVMYG